MIHNPILPGFNPDPSTCRVGDDYYIATSTFEWYPGVQIHHSRDLVELAPRPRPLDRQRSSTSRRARFRWGLGAPACPPTGRILARLHRRETPRGASRTLTIISSPRRRSRAWSDPTYVNSSGFDPSLFHDDDGRKWFVNMVWDHRRDGPARNRRHPAFAGILLQEYDAASGRLVGPVDNIFSGSDTGWSRGRISTSGTAGTI